MASNPPKPEQPKCDHSFVPYEFDKMDRGAMVKKSFDFMEGLKKRRSVRDFSGEQVPVEVIENIVMTACSAPSGANKQPWHFCLVGNSKLKSSIRAAAEEEELRSYAERMSDQWLKDLEPLGTNHVKPFLEEAPYLIVVFKKPYDLVNGKKIPNYYVNESVGIAVGMLIAALHNAGLATLTHTPSPMNFLQEILERPDNERAYLLLPVGYPKDGAEVPEICRKEAAEVMTQYF